MRLDHFLQRSRRSRLDIDLNGVSIVISQQDVVDGVWRSGALGPSDVPRVENRGNPEMASL